MLNDQQNAFVIAYTCDPERNAARAYAAAGYAARGHVAEVNASRLLKHPAVKAAMQAFEQDELARARARAGISLERALASIASVAHADIAELFDEVGGPKAPHELSAEMRQAIESIEATEVGEGAQKVRRYRYKLASRAAHRDMLMRHLNAYKAHESAKGEGVANGLGALLSQLRGSVIPVVHDVVPEEVL